MKVGSAGAMIRGSVIERPASHNEHSLGFTMKKIILTSLFAIVFAASPAVAQDGQNGERTEVPAKTAAEIRREANARAVKIVLEASRADHPRLRANAIEAARYMPDRILPMAQLAVEDEHEAVRFAALALTGELKIKGMMSAARKHLDDDSPAVRAAALFALHQLGENVNLTPMAETLMSGNPQDRGAAIQLFGMMDDASAVPMLKQAATAKLDRHFVDHEPMMRLQASEAIVNIVDRVPASKKEFLEEYQEQALTSLRSAPFRTNPGSFEQAVESVPEDRVHAVLILGRIGDVRMRGAIEQMLVDQPIEVKLAAAEYCIRTGEPRGKEVVMQATQSTLAPARAQAANVLGLYRDAASAARVVEMMDDSDPMVKVMAAAALIRGPYEAPSSSARR